jgi:hypothetical protein
VILDDYIQEDLGPKVMSGLVLGKTCLVEQPKMKLKITLQSQEIDVGLNLFNI